MRILAVDTATKSCSVAIVEKESIIAEATLFIEQTHSKHLMEMIDTVLNLSGLTVSELDGFAVTRGPGSFTGLRIGISSIKGFAMASGKPVVAFNTGGNPELIEHDISGLLVKFGNIDGLANSVAELLINEKKRKKIGMCAANRVKQFFDVRVNAERTAEIYSNLIEDNVKKLF